MALWFSEGKSLRSFLPTSASFLHGVSSLSARSNGPLNVESLFRGSAQYARCLHRRSDHLDLSVRHGSKSRVSCRLSEQVHRCSSPSLSLSEGKGSFQMWKRTPRNEAAPCPRNRV